MEMKNIADGSKFGSSTATMGKAIGGKTARPCDVCRRERSRWYCAADEAYLCDDCDGSVHTANSVARRHERMRLEPIKAEPKREDHSSYNSAFMATRKRTRTSRPHPHGNHRSLKPKTVKDEFRSPVPVEVPVPQNSPSEEFRPAVDDDDDLLHKVPVFVPLAEEFCVSTRTSNLPGSTTSTAIKIDRTSPSSPDQNYSSDCARNPAAMANNCDLNHFLDSETDLCEFAVDMEMDMESIIGQGLDEGLGVLGSLYGTEKDHHRTSNKRDYNNCRSSLTRDSSAQRETDGASSEPDHPCAEDGDGSLGWLWGRVKVEDQKDAKTAQLASDTCHKIDPRDALDARVKVEDPDESWDTIELNIDCNELAAEEEEELDEGQEPYTTVEPSDIKLRGDHVDQDVKIKLDLDSIFRPSAHTDFSEEKKLISLRLNYEDVLTAWSDRGSPWACGKRPESVSDDCSSDGAGLVPDLSIPNGQLGEQVELGQVPVMNNGGGHGGREARVLRYREKRRTRLFSKKIRYEVRKLNAEKRPRMKGRFVKRTSRMSSD